MTMENPHEKTRVHLGSCARLCGQSLRKCGRRMHREVPQTKAINKSMSDDVWRIGMICYPDANHGAGPYLPTKYWDFLFGKCR